MGTMRGAALLLGLSLALAGCETPPQPADGPAAEATTPVAPSGLAVLGGTRGTSAEISALGRLDPSTLPTYRVNSVDEEYEILRGLGLRPGTQALVRDAAGRHYDIIDTPTGPVLFDISSFFGAEA
jgi:hypothetical protein